MATSVDEMLCEEMAQLGWGQAEPWLREFLPEFLRELSAVGLAYNLMGSDVGPWLSVSRPGSKGMMGDGFEDMDIFLKWEDFKVGAGSNRGWDVDADGFRKDHLVCIHIRPMEGPESVILKCHKDPAHGISIKNCAMLIEVISKIEE